MKYLTILLVLLTVPAIAQDQDETLTCAGVSTAEWTDVVGSGCALMEDASHTTYIEADAVNTINLYTVDDCAYSYTVIDSLVFTWSEQSKNASKGDDMYTAIITTDSIYVSAYVPSDTWTDSSRVMATKPGGGAWTVTDVNAVTVKFVHGATHGGGGAVRADSFQIVVWGTREAGAETPTRRRRMLTGE